MKVRRRLLFGSTIAQALAPLLAAAQGAQCPKRIGVLSGATRPVPWESSTLHGLRDGLSELGYVEGRDFVMEWRFAEGQYDRFPAFVQEFIAMRVDLIFAVNTRAAIEAKRATSSIPIVFAALSDPVGSGLVARFAQSGGNVTGVGQDHELVVAKHLELVALAVPSLSRLAVMFNPENPFYSRLIKRLEIETQKANVVLSLASVRRLEELEPALASMQRERTQAVILLDDSLFISNRARLA
jgi:putative ABC transport system substrate-binding protein